ncbi:hypothetical protein LC560_02125 [Fusobacterium animalis]|uniref:hypothetical protein n=1 Tax=Fusobacterium animalis TaxID=76859 RepID=UPI0030D1164A
MFKIYNYNNQKEFSMSSEELKNYIIEKTNSIYENRTVAPERTGQRPSFLAPYLEKLKENITLLKGIFLITSLSRVNNNKKTRYMLVSTGNKDDYLTLLPYLNDYISFINIDCSNYNPVHEGGYLSTWFRQNMGRAFSFIDIDFLILKKSNTNTSIYLLEEKTNQASLGYGQQLSYIELMTDIFTIIPCLCIINTSNSGNYYLKVAKGDFKKNYKEGKITIEQLITFFNK